jgi:hypothetical protein
MQFNSARELCLVGARITKYNSSFGRAQIVPVDYQHLRLQDFRVQHLHIPDPEGQRDTSFDLVG